jgi:hypothetical protein
VAAQVAVVAGAEAVPEEEELEADEAVEAVPVASSVPPPAAVARRPAGGTGRRKGRGGAGAESAE